MRRSFSVLVLLISVAGFELGCYEDSFVSPSFTQAQTRVFLAGAPFPYGDVGKAEVYVVDIAASTEVAPTSDPGAWTHIAAPMRRFDVQELRHGKSVLLGAAQLAVDRYRALRVTINQDSSFVTFFGGAQAKVRWQKSGLLSVFATVEEPIFVPISGTSVAIKFDVGRSFLSGSADPLHDFLFDPVISAVNSANTGSIVGNVLGDSDRDGSAEPLENTSISVYRGDRTQTPESWIQVANGFSDSTGYYKIGFLLAGAYIVRIDPPQNDLFGPLIAHEVEVLAGEDFIFSVTLPAQNAATILNWR